MSMIDQMIEERRNAILKCWQVFQEHPPTVLIAEAIERSKTDLPAWFAPWAPGVVIASDYLLKAAGHRPRSRRPEGWSEGKNPDVFTKGMHGNQLMVRGCGEFWTVERFDEVLACPFGPLPVFTRTSHAAMRLAEYCHPLPQEGDKLSSSRPRRVASGLHWVDWSPSGVCL
jgi:hypothetical protein